MPDPTSTRYGEIIKRLDEVRKRENYFRLLRGIMVSLSISMAVVAVASVVEEIFNLPPAGRTVIFIIGSVAVASACGWYFIRPLLIFLGLLPSPSNESIALRVGKHFPHIRDRLLDALQLYENKNLLTGHYSPTLIDASFADLFVQIEPLSFTKIIDPAPLRKTAKRTAYTYGLFILFLIFLPTGFFGSLYRILHFTTHFASPLLVQLYAEPGNTEVLRGQNVPITVYARGKVPATITFASRQAGQVDYDNQHLSVNAGGVFTTEISKIKSKTEYYAFTEGSESERYVITVLDRPLIRRLQLTITPPGYTRLPPRVLDEASGVIEAYTGSRASLELTASKYLSGAEVRFQDSSRLALATDNERAVGTFTVRDNASYHILLRDRDSLSNIDPVEYSIRIITDEYPSVEILSPGKNLDLTEEKKLDLYLRLKDDFGFSELRLAHRLAHSKYEKPSDEFTFTTIPLANKNQNQIETWFHWDLSPFHLVPEDAVAYYVEVFDNDNISGPKSSRSGIFFLRLPSLEEVFADVSDIHDQSLQSMENLAQETNQLKREMEDLTREMKKNRNTMDWQQQKKAEEMLQRYDEMKKRINDITRSFDEMVGKMNENKLVSEETLEKYLELQQLMEDFNSPELQEALRKLRDSMKQTSPDDMKMAMEQLKLTEEQFRQNLERTIELLKRIHIELKLDELIKRTEEMTREQETLQKETDKTNPSDSQKREELARKQDDLQKQMKNLEDETSSLQKKMEEFPTEMPIEQMDKALDYMQKNKPGEKMEMSSSQLRSGDMSSSKESQSQAQMDLKQMKENFEQMKMAMLDSQKKQIVNKMRKQLENILELSKREESLKDETKGLDPNSQRFRENTQRQHEVMSDLTNTAQEMTELAKKSFAISSEMGKEIGNALNQMADAMRMMEARNPGASSQQQGMAMGSLNRAAMMLQSTLGQMMQGGQGGMGMAGLMAQLQQMSGMQGSINMATQQAMGMGQGRGELLSAQQQAEYQRLSAQQAAVQKSLEQLSREAKDAGEYSRLLGDLDRIAKDMQEVQTDLQQGNVNPNTLQKQERIFSRLLESARSMRERDYEKRRRADPGKDVVRPSPSEFDVTSQEGKNKLREELLKALEGKYTRDYEELIKKYFEQLEKEITPR
jgi:hypothetical protein